MSRRPTTLIETTTVTAVNIDRARLMARTGIPAARAYSSSCATANSHGEQGRHGDDDQGEQGEDEQVVGGGRGD